MCISRQEKKTMTLSHCQKFRMIVDPPGIHEARLSTLMMGRNASVAMNAVNFSEECGFSQKNRM